MSMLLFNVCDTFAVGLAISLTML